MRRGSEPGDMESDAIDALAALLALEQAVSASEIEVTPARAWHLRGSIDALDALLGLSERRGRSTDPRVARLRQRVQALHAAYPPDTWDDTRDDR